MSKSGAEVAAEFKAMPDHLLISEACWVLSGVLEHWEGNDDYLADYGEIRCKCLLAELQSRSFGTR
jgi:hypothetical protein